MTSIARSIAALLTAASVITSAHAQSDRPLAFVGCPQFRQASVGCWTIEHGGTTYYLGNPANNLAPQLRHKVLVEGTVDATGPQICGGVPFKPLYVSVLSEVSPECETMLPPIPGMEPPGNFMSEQTLTFIQAGPPPADLAYAAHPLTVAFDFNSSFIFLPKQIQIEMLINVARKAKAKKVILTPSFGESILSDGSRMIEDPKVMQHRVDVIREAFINLGYPAQQIEVAPFPEHPSLGPDARNLVIDVRI